ncbi:protein of unknown function [Priestia endophytica DSM 13796]|uniref:ImmA/IrrE family metallo-endopeptidase n=1 Tax=Priestia endophytica DSM 13796 TaxID=1121089 RepID=A0A1I5YQ19_9BACI|nr:protein of unknown function [Priestia endophytica DSM 13796]
MSKTYKKKSVEEKKKEVENLTKNMEKRIEQHFHSPQDLKEYLSFMGKFYQYSISNVALIQSQFPGAKAVGSFAFWKSKGFAVQKGEKGIGILVPQRTVPKFKDENGKWKSVNKATKEEKKLLEEGKKEVKDGGLYFSVGYTFDISQTNATTQDLPKIFPNRWIEGNIENYAALYKGMEAIAQKNGISIVEPRGELGAAKGVSYTLTKEVALNPRNSEKQNVKTLLHELTHATLHTKETFDNYTSAEKEFQAEMTAYTVASHFNIDTSDYSLDYLAHWTKGKEFKDKTQLLKEVHTTSVNFIETIEEHLQKGKEPLLAQEKRHQHETVPPSSENIGERLKASYTHYRQTLHQESPQDTDSILDCLTAGDNYHTSKQTALNKGWVGEKDIVKMEKQVDSSFQKEEKEKSPQASSLKKRTGKIKRKKSEYELER